MLKHVSWLVHAATVGVHGGDGWGINDSSSGFKRLFANESDPEYAVLDTLPNITRRTF